jgi:hypothetical protein
LYLRATRKKWMTTRLMKETNFIPCRSKAPLGGALAAILAARVAPYLSSFRAFFSSRTWVHTRQPSSGRCNDAFA